MATNRHAALLIMDYQTSILQNLPDPQPLLHNASKAIATAREKGIPVIYVVVGFRPGMPEVTDSNKSFSAFKEKLKDADMAAWMEIHADVAPLEGDLLIVKRRVSAFTGSDLEVILRANGIRHLVLCGVSTSGVVLSTTREAADKDYQLTILSDGCADPDAEVHQVLTTKVFPRQAEVISVQEWIEKV